MNDFPSVEHLPVIIFDAVRKGEILKISAPRGGLLASLGVAVGDGAALTAAIHPEDRERFLTPSPQAADTLLRLATAGHPWRWLRLQTTPLGDGGCCGLLVCAERLKAAEESAQRYRDYAEISSDWYWEQDAELKFTHFSREFEEITGVPTANALGRTRWEGLGREHLGNIDWAAHQRETTAHCPFRNFEYPSRRPDGRLVWFRVSGVPRFDDDGNFLGYFGIAADITATKTLENELLQSQRMAALGQLAAGVAHEINNPLGFVRSNLASLDNYLATLFALAAQLAALAPAGAAWQARVEALTRAADLEFLRDDSRQLLDECRQGLDRVRQIVGDLREFSREGDAEWCDENLHHCIDSAANLIAGKLPDGAAIERNYATLPPLRCRPLQLNQVFLALLTNAVQAIGTSPGRISLSTGSAGESQWAEVTDNGCGIAGEHLAHIFDPFFTTRPVGDGKGMGLSTCFGIVAEHGGKIEVHSTPGAGATFRVSLPLHPAGVTPGS